MCILNIVFSYEWEIKQLKYLFWVDQQNNHKISELVTNKTMVHIHTSSFYLIGMMVGS